MNRREFLQTTAATAAATTLQLSEAAAATPARRPNILYIFSDQHRAVSMPGEPYSQAIAPNLDTFRRANFSMENCISNYPLCTPYRGILMSGRWPQQTGLVANGVRLNPAEQTLGTTFQKAGYKTGYVGKWHLAGEPEGFIPAGPDRLGFQDWHVWDLTNNHYHSHTYDPVTGAKIQPEGWNCTLMTDQAVQLLGTQPKDRPWLLMVSWNPPHPPFNPPAEDANRFPPGGLRFRPNVHLALPGQPVNGPAHPLASDDALRQAEQGYYGGITGVDLEFARLLDALDQSGQADNTIVIYTSDHGEMMGSHGRMAKQVPFEESCRVPFYIRYPGVTAKGGTSDALFASIDIYPTLCGLAGIPIPGGRGGRDLSGLFRGSAKAGRTNEVVFLMNVVPHLSASRSDGDNPDGEDVRGTELLVSQPTYRGVRTATHTYAVMETGRWCLYDNVQDPYQMRNLVADAALQPLMTELDAKIAAWLRATGDTFPLSAAVTKTANFPV